MNTSKAQEIVNRLDLGKIKSRSLRNRVARFQNKSRGFTLLELLVVVAILAAIASTATIMLQDTDRRASAAMHVAAMDELAKGIATWRVMHSAQFPDVYDSLIENDSNSTDGGTLIGDADTALTDFLDATELEAAQVAALKAVGITQLRVLNTGATPPGGTATSCATAEARAAVMLNKNNDFVNSNLFRSAAAGATGRGGCGFDANYTLPDTEAATFAVWKEAENYRINAGDEDTVVALGLGPDNTLFRPGELGALSSSPIYRHVDNVTYNRFIALINLDATGGEPQLQAVIDPSGDTRDEELGEFDGTRSTL